MLMVVLDHIKGMQIITKDIMYIYHAKRSCIPYDWYLSPRSGMSGFITGGPMINKKVEIVAVSKRWEFSVSELEGLPKVSWVHGVLGSYSNLTSDLLGCNFNFCA